MKRHLIIGIIGSAVLLALAGEAILQALELQEAGIRYCMTADLANQGWLLWYLRGHICVGVVYYAIPVVLWLFLPRATMEEIPRWIIWAFIAFISACGTSHMGRVFSVYYGGFWLEIAAVWWTSIISFATLVGMVFFTKDYRSAPSRRELKAALESAIQAKNEATEIREQFTLVREEINEKNQIMTERADQLLENIQKIFRGLVEAEIKQVRLEHDLDSVVGSLEGALHGRRTSIPATNA